MNTQEGNIYQIEKEQLSIAQRIVLLNSIKDYYQDNEEYELCEQIKNLIKDYKQKQRLDSCNFRYTILIKRYTKDTR